MPAQVTPITSLRNLMGFLTNMNDVLLNAPLEMSCLGIINNYRAELGVPELGMSQTLWLGATGKGKDMKVHNYFDHECPARPSSGNQPFGFDDLLKAAGYTEPDGSLKNTWIGEILVGHAASAQTAFNAWKNSPGHDAIMRDPHYRYVGIAAQARTDGAMFWAAEFGGVA